VGIVIAVVSTGIITVLTLGGSRAPHSLDAVRASGGSVTGSAAATADPPGTPQVRPARRRPATSPRPRPRGPRPDRPHQTHQPHRPISPGGDHGEAITIALEDGFRIGLTHVDVHAHADSHVDTHRDTHAHRDTHRDAHAHRDADLHRDNTGAVITAASGQEQGGQGVARDGVVALFRLSGYSFRLSTMPDHTSVVRMQDQEVVAAIVAGDPDGIAEAYDRYAAPLYAYCSLALPGPDTADVVRDTFLIATWRLEGLRDPGKLGSWLHAVVRSECLRRRSAAA